MDSGKYRPSPDKVDDRQSSSASRVVAGAFWFVNLFRVD